MTKPGNTILRKRIAFAVFSLVVVFCLAVMIGSGGKRAGVPVSPSGKWTCSMCPQFILPEPGKCPKCFMDLIPLEVGAGGGSRLELHLTPEKAELAGITSDIAEAVAPRRRPSGGYGGGKAPTLSIPASAVLTSRGRAFVFVESIDEEHIVYTMREVFPAGRENDRCLIASGLDEGDVVAATGVFRIDSAMQILGKISIATLPDGELSAAEEAALPPYRPAERSLVNIRTERPDIDAWFERYEQVRAALARDDAAQSGRPARELSEMLAKAAPLSDDRLDGIVSRLASASRDMAMAADLPSRRTAFETVTADMVLLARRSGSPGGGLNLIFCPMAFGGSGAYWLQPGDIVDNPYHGLEMPLCGWAVDAIPPFAAGDALPSPANQE